MRLLFYFSPILYGRKDPEAADGIVRFYTLNPFVGILELNRAVWFPDELDNAGVAGYRRCCLVLTGAFFVLGWTVFARLSAVLGAG
jgi:ABC-2 type transport system permease protein